MKFSVQLYITNFPHFQETYSSEEEDVLMNDMGNLEDAIAKFENIQIPNVKRGMFVSGWDDPDDSVEEDENPEGTYKPCSSVSPLSHLIPRPVSIPASDDRLILFAAEKGDLETVRKILERSPDSVHATDADKYTPLHRAAYENHLEMAELLLQHNANINAQTEFGWTPLHSACKWNHPDMVALLLQHDADVNALSDGSQTPLHIAATVSDCRDTLVALLSHDSIKPDLLNNSDETAFAIARRTGTSYPVFEMFRKGVQVETGLVD